MTLEEFTKKLVKNLNLKVNYDTKFSVASIKIVFILAIAIIVANFFAIIP